MTLPTPVCQTRTVFNPGVGTPPGTLEQNATIAANGLGGLGPNNTELNE